MYWHWPGEECAAREAVVTAVVRPAEYLLRDNDTGLPIRRYAHQVCKSTSTPGLPRENARNIGEALFLAGRMAAATKLERVRCLGLTRNLSSGHLDGARDLYRAIEDGGPPEDDE